MTPEEIAEIRAREQAATPGPWTWSAGMIEAPPGVDGGMEAVLWTANIPGEHDDDDYRAALGACGNHTEEHAADNLAFVAHAREDVPGLLEHLEAQYALIAEARTVARVLVNRVGIETATAMLNHYVDMDPVPDWLTAVPGGGHDSA